MRLCALISTLIALVGGFAGCATEGDEPPYEPLARPDGGTGGGGDDGDGKGDGSGDDDVDPVDDEPCPVGYLDSTETESGCEPDPEAVWDVTVISGQFTPRQPDGGKWELLDAGLPDGYVHIVFGFQGYEVETQPDEEKLEPAWGSTLIWAASTDDLHARFDIGLWDDDPWDPTGDDLMAECSFTFPDEVFALGAFDLQDYDESCPSVRLGLRLAQ